MESRKYDAGECEQRRNYPLIHKQGRVKPTAEIEDQEREGDTKMDARVTFELMDRLNYPQIEREVFSSDGYIHATILAEAERRCI